MTSFVHPLRVHELCNHGSSAVAAHLHMGFICYSAAQSLRRMHMCCNSIDQCDVALERSVMTSDMPVHELLLAHPAGGEGTNDIWLYGCFVLALTGCTLLQVDGALLAHPLVAEAVAFGAPDEKYGEVVAAAVVLSKPVDDEKAVVKDIQAQTAKRLASFKVRCSATHMFALVCHVAWRIFGCNPGMR